MRYLEKFSKEGKNFFLGIYDNLTREEVHSNTVLEAFLVNIFGSPLNFLRDPYPKISSGVISLSHKKIKDKYILAVVASKDFRYLGVDIELLENVLKCRRVQLRYRSSLLFEPVTEFALREAAVKCFTPMFAEKIYFTDIKFSPNPEVFGTTGDYMSICYKGSIIGLVFL